MSALRRGLARRPSPVQRLPEMTRFSLGVKIGEAGKIKGRSTPCGRWRCLHGGWRGTRPVFARAAKTPKAALRLAIRRAADVRAFHSSLGDLG